MSFLGLEGKTAIVTGAGSNIGRGIALAFVEHGSNVVIAELDPKQGEKVAGECNGLCKDKSRFVKTDVTDWSSAQAMVRAALDSFGQIDILVNCVGWVMDRLFIEKPRDEWEKEIQRNLWSDINCIRAVLDHMIERKYGKIINISSDAGRIGEYREAVYSACKGGVIAMSKSLARELGRYGININVICPSVVVPDTQGEVSKESMWSKDTGLMDILGTDEAKQKIAKGMPLRRLGRPVDIANSVLFFASDRASFITGQTLGVDGGYVMI
jgi:2-hydroxycyclohexanecarboxyl-CoA dehydrogenase